MDQWMENGKHYIRGSEDDTWSSFGLYKIETGEIQLFIYDANTGEQMMIGITNRIGGGLSPNTHKALENLALAIDKDNEEHPMIVRDVATQEQISKNRFILNRKRTRISGRKK